jgi:hypothetical protein
MYISEGKKKELRRAFDQGLRDIGSKAEIVTKAPPESSAPTAPGSPERMAQIKREILGQSGGGKVERAQKDRKKEFKKRRKEAIERIANKSKPKLNVTKVDAKKTFREFLEEAKRIRFLSVYRGDSKEVAQDIKKNKSARSSEYGVYGPGVYASSDRNVARHYSGSSGNRPHTDVGVTKSRIPVKSIKTIGTPEHSDSKGIQKSRELVYGDPKTSVRIKNAASGQERTSDAPNKKPRKNESDYLVVNQDTFNRGITTQPTMRAKGKERRTKTQPKK